MIIFTKLADSDHPHFAQDLFEDAFPKEERPPFASLKHRDGAKFHFLVASNGDGDGDQGYPVGILTYWNFEDFVYVEHFAIASELRNQGFGKAVFLDFMMQQSEQVVLEVEMPHDEQSEHRIEFYSSMGLFRNVQQYEQPSYYGLDSVIPMIIMSKYELDDDEFLGVKDVLYSEVYGVSVKK